MEGLTWPAVADRVMASKDLLVLTPPHWACVIWQAGIEGLAGVTNTNWPALKQGDGPGLSGRVQCHHQGLQRGRGRRTCEAEEAGLSDAMAP